MEKSRANTKSTGVCERIWKGFAGNSAFRAIHRISSRSWSLSPASANGVQATDISAQPQVPLKKQVAPHQAGRAEVDIPIFHKLPESQSENVKTSVTSSQGHLNKATSKKEAKPAVDSAEVKVKPNQKAEKPKDQPASTTTRTRATPRDDEVGEGKKPEVTDGAEKFSTYINSVRNKFRTKSDMGAEKTQERPPPTRIATRRDSFNDRVAQFINRGRKNMRTT